MSAGKFDLVAAVKELSLDDNDNNSEYEPSADAAEGVFSINEEASIVYGVLVVLGRQGVEMQTGTPLSNFYFKQRKEPNGLKLSSKKVETVKALQKSEYFLDSGRYSVSSTTGEHEHKVQAYVEDETTDLFQIGRGPVVNDFTIEDSELMRTISRFACRFIVDRNYPYSVRVFAAGFDQHKNIFLGENATKWKYPKKNVDGLTTNGILVGNFDAESTESGNAGWYEVSVAGQLYNLFDVGRGNTDNPSFLPNTLKDGSIIDLCGLNLLFRSFEGVQHAPTKQDLNILIDSLNSQRPQCPVGLNTLVFPQLSKDDGIFDEKLKNNNGTPTRLAGRRAELGRHSCVGPCDWEIHHPHIYMPCGHVHGHWKSIRFAFGSTQCPLCRQDGKFVRLEIGIEPLIWLDKDIPTHAFNPCGHMTSEKTAKYWQNILMLTHKKVADKPRCPFCACCLDDKNGIVRLILQDNTGH